MLGQCSLLPACVPVTPFPEILPPSLPGQHLPLTPERKPEQGAPCPSHLMHRAGPATAAPPRAERCLQAQQESSAHGDVHPRSLCLQGGNAWGQGQAFGMFRGSVTAAGPGGGERPTLAHVTADASMSPSCYYKAGPSSGADSSGGGVGCVPWAVQQGGMQWGRL